MCACRPTQVQEQYDCSHHRMLLPVFHRFWTHFRPTLGGHAQAKTPQNTAKQAPGGGELSPAVQAFCMFLETVYFSQRDPRPLGVPTDVPNQSLLGYGGKERRQVILDCVQCLLEGPKRVYSVAASALHGQHAPWGIRPKAGPTQEGSRFSKVGRHPCPHRRAFTSPPIHEPPITRTP